MTHSLLFNPRWVWSVVKHENSSVDRRDWERGPVALWQCLASVWRRFLPRDGGRSTGPQSTRPFFCSQLVPWAFPPLTNLRVDKFTWRPNKCSPIITKLNFMVSFSPCNENYYIQIVAVCVHLTCGHWVPFWWLNKNINPTFGMNILDKTLTQHWQVHVNLLSKAALILLCSVIWAPAPSQLWERKRSNGFNP